MLKLLACVIILLCGVGTGVYLLRRLSSRFQILESFYTTLHRASVRISYTSCDLCEAFSDNFAGFTFGYTDPFDNQWNELIARYRFVLKEEDMKILSDFIKDMGATDSDGQQKIIEMYSGMLEEQMRKARDEINEKSKLYRVLPLSVAIILSLLII